MSDTFLFFFQDTKAIFSKHVCKDYINSVPIFLLLLFLFFPFYMSMFIYVCTDVTQLFFQSVFLLLPNDIKHFLPLLCWCISVGPKLFNFWFLTDKIKNLQNWVLFVLIKIWVFVKYFWRLSWEVKGGGGDRVLQNSGYSIKYYWLVTLWFFIIHPQRMRGKWGFWGGGCWGGEGDVARFLHISGIKI